MKLEIRNTIIPTNIVEHWQKVVDAISDLLSIPSAMINRVAPPDFEIFRSNISADNPFPLSEIALKLNSAIVFALNAQKSYTPIWIFN